MKFGTEELHLALQEACAAGDLSYAAEILYEPVWRTSRLLFAKKRDRFALYTREDQEDAVHNALLYMLDRLDKLAYPNNDGIPNYSFYAEFVLNGLCQNRYRIMQRAAQISPDDPIPGGAASDDDRERTLQDILPSAQPLPDAVLIAREELHKALSAFFSLRNSPETLVSVGFIILNENLGIKPMSLKQCVEYFTTHSVAEVLAVIEKILVQNDQDTGVLAPLKSRLRSGSAVPSFDGITEARLANRKNDILTRMRKILQQEKQ